MQHVGGGSAAQEVTGAYNQELNHQARKLFFMKDAQINMSWLNFFKQTDLFSVVIEHKLAFRKIKNSRNLVFVI